MTGNVFELTHGGLGKDEAVVHGGTFLNDAFTNTSFNRQVVETTWRDISIGLRVCASPPP